MSALNVKGLLSAERVWRLRLREKNGKVNEMPCHHKLEVYLDEYLKAAGFADDRKGPLFRGAIRRTLHTSGSWNVLCGSHPIGTTNSEEAV